MAPGPLPGHPWSGTAPAATLQLSVHGVFLSQLNDLSGIAQAWRKDGDALTFGCGLPSVADCDNCHHAGVPASWWLLRAQHPCVDQLDQIPLILVLGVQPGHQNTVQVSLQACKVAEHAIHVSRM